MIAETFIGGRRYTQPVTMSPTLYSKALQTRLLCFDISIMSKAWEISMLSFCISWFRRTMTPPQIRYDIFYSAILQHRSALYMYAVAPRRLRLLTLQRLDYDDEHFRKTGFIQVRTNKHEGIHSNSQEHRQTCNAQWRKHHQTIANQTRRNDDQKSWLSPIG